MERSSSLLQVALNGSRTSAEHPAPLPARRGSAAPRLPMPRSSSSSPVTSSATADMYTACAAPIGVWESKITMLTCGRVVTLRECLASGDETQDA